MKFFKKKRNKLPRPGAVERLMKRLGDQYQRRYVRELRVGHELPLAIREVTLARLHPHNRQSVLYYPDIRNFQIVGEPNRSLPIGKFLDLFRGMIDKEILDSTLHTLTNYRVEIYTTPEKWLEVYADETVHTCMSGVNTITCYIHPENHLAVAALYAPGGTRVIGRTIVNTEEKWYVRLFGDSILVNKLNEMGYHRLSSPPTMFKMYGYSPRYYHRETVAFPYFDFPYNSVVHHPETYNPETQLFEATVS